MDGGVECSGSHGTGLLSRDQMKQKGGALAAGREPRRPLGRGGRHRDKVRGWTSRRGSWSKCCPFSTEPNRESEACKCPQQLKTSRQKDLIQELPYPQHLESPRASD